ncbi:hypothetical protein [Puia sp.]|jgi:hypothetical protein|uniref:hypothetical protein n=1 Tax=Puia sp. TaxID=2045100 RepID=UPI002F40FC6E
MEKILQIIAVFVLMMLVIHRFIRGREPAYRPYNYLSRLRPPLAMEIGGRLVAAVFQVGQVETLLVDEARQLLFSYNAAGSLTIHRRKGEEGLKEMQWLAAPLDCTGMALDPEDGRLYLEAGGFLFVFGR